ncbi:hypothetical protein RI367_007789 [Sorochytrium milnesiophthora]
MSEEEDRSVAVDAPSGTQNKPEKTPTPLAETSIVGSAPIEDGTVVSGRLRKVPKKPAAQKSVVGDIDASLNGRINTACFETQETAQLAVKDGITIDDRVYSFSPCSNLSLADVNTTVKVVDLRCDVTVSALEHHLFRFESLDKATVTHGKRRSWGTIAFKESQLAPKLPSKLVVFSSWVSPLAYSLSTPMSQRRITTASSSSWSFVASGAYGRWSCLPLCSGHPDSETLLIARQTRVQFRGEAAEWCLPSDQPCFHCDDPTH